MHCLQAFHDAETTVGRDIAAATGMTKTAPGSPTRSSGLPPALSFDQAEDRLHTIKAVLMATLA